jgi:SSS family solute:Na+ symporter
MKRATATGAIAGVVANLLFTLWATLTLNGKTLDLGKFNFPLHDYMIGAIGHIVLLVVGIVVSLSTAGKVEGEDLTLWGWRSRNATKHQKDIPAFR